jgi:hypothetical protein
VKDTATASPLSGIRPKPLLASEALREDVAPLVPASRGARVLAASAAATLAVAGVMPYLGLAARLDPVAMISTAGACALLAAVAIFPLSYRIRATALLVLGTALLGEAVSGRGPGAALGGYRGTTLVLELARMGAAILLPAALLFRAHYRAYALARSLLAGALVLAAPFVVRSAMMVAHGDTLGPRIAAGSTIVAIVVSVVGFMGAGTTALGSAWATGVLLALASDVAARSALASDLHGAVSPLVAAAVFLAAAALSAMGLFQLLAARYADDARRVDVHQPIPENDTEDRSEAD